jgi:hypothetical protein
MRLLCLLKHGYFRSTAESRCKCKCIYFTLLSTFMIKYAYSSFANAAWIPDVLIVGTGPSGLAAVACLVARGIPTTVLEMSASRSTSPAAYVSCRCSHS